MMAESSTAGKVGGATGRVGGTPSKGSDRAGGRQHRPAQKGAAAPGKRKRSNAPSVEDNERYVVVITNVENDFAKVHEEAIQRYCCLNEQHNRRHHSRQGQQQQQQPSTPADGDLAEAAVGTRRQCHYTVTPRTETRSVEVSIYGKADADVATVYLPVRTNAQKKDSNTNSKGIQKKDSKDKNKATSVETGGEEVVECVKGPVVHDTLFATMEDMAMALRHKPYFTHPPKFLLNVSGKEDGEVLREAKQRKRQRNGQQEQDESNPVDAADSQRLQQTDVRQAGMITAAATTSARMTTKEVQQQLKDIPGFMSCWMLYPQHFRFVFANKTALFKAKHLLDQFEVDGHVRVSLTLSDGAAKEFAAYLASVEATA